MISLVVKISRSGVEINRLVFIKLLSFSALSELSVYQKALEENGIAFSDLKSLAERAGIPYPLFFAPLEVVIDQVIARDKFLFSKIAPKNEVQLTSRGKFEQIEINLIVQDLARKQLFLRRILPSMPHNTFVGSQARLLNSGESESIVAKNIRDYFQIDLSQFRRTSKLKVLEYLTSCIEAKGIFVSFSSYNHMPQNIPPETYLSGVCIKDNKVPFIFINTRDGDTKPKIIESDGRQIFTLLTMLVCISINKFVINSRTGKSAADPIRIAYSIASEIIIPNDDLEFTFVTDLDSLKKAAYYFKVTPSLLLYKLVQANRVEPRLAVNLRNSLKEAVKQAKPAKMSPPNPVNAYGKYNGRRFSEEVVTAYKKGIISHMEVKNVLFRKSKRMDSKLFLDYNAKFSLT